jgi:hypothetical protein
MTPNAKLSAPPTMPSLTMAAMRVGYFGALIRVKYLSIIAGFLVGSALVWMNDNPLWLNFLIGLAAGFSLEVVGFVCRIIGGKAQVRYIARVIAQQDDEETKRCFGEMNAEARYGLIHTYLQGQFANSPRASAELEEYVQTRMLGTRQP